MVPSSENNPLSHHSSYCGMDMQYFNTVPSHNTRPGLRIVTQEHEMLSGGITWLSSSASNYQITKHRPLFFFMLFPVKTAQ